MQSVGDLAGRTAPCTPAFSRLPWSGLVIAGLIAVWSDGAQAQTRARIDLPPTSLQSALSRVAATTGSQIVFDSEALRGRRSRALRGDYTMAQAVEALLAGSDLGYTTTRTGVFVITRRAVEPGQPETVALSDVIVTARKREERSVDVPIALTAVTGQAVEDRGDRNLVEVLQQEAGVGIYDNGNGLSKVTIRGVSTSLGGNENGYYLDELPFTGVTVPIVPDVRAWDLERVEVLRGPQGTLFGEGALGGTIRILTAGADLNDWEVKANASASRTDGGGENTGIKGAINLPIVQNVLAVRLTATHEAFDGWIDNDLTGAQDVNEQTYDAFRAKLRFDPTDRLSIRASYWKSENRNPNGGSSATDDGQQSRANTLANAVIYRLVGASGRYELNGSEVFYGYARNRFSLPQHGDIGANPISALIDIDLRSHEVRWSSITGGPLQWTVGAYQRQAARTDDLQYAQLGLDNLSITDTTARAVFGEATYSLPGAPIDVTAGLRYFHDTLENRTYDFGDFTDRRGGSYASLNPRFSIAWRPVDNTNIYLSVSKGFRSGQIQAGTSSIAEAYGIDLPDKLEQDTIWTYELGAKADLADQRLWVQAAAYYSRWNDVAVRIPIGDTSFNGRVNSDGAEIRGIEASLVARPVEGLTLTGGGSYTLAQYVEGVPGTTIVAGSPVDDVSKYTAAASADYRWTVNGDVTGFARASWLYTSPRSFESFPLYQEGDVISRIDARLGVGFGEATVTVFIDNLTNEDGATTFRTVTDLGAGDLDIISPPLRPRTIGLEATLRFGGGYEP